MHKINVIGIGQGTADLTETHKDIIGRCDVLVGGTRHLEMFDTHEKKTIPIKGPIQDIIVLIKQEATQNHVVVLASGDPLFYGIGSVLIEKLGKNNLVIHSNISSISAAFAAIKEPWHDARIISLHGKHFDKSLFVQLSNENKLAFLTDRTHDPHYIAAQFSNIGAIDFNLCVLENLGNTETQRITWFEHMRINADHTFCHPNIVILLRTKEKGRKSAGRPQVHIGMDDMLFRHQKGLITKSEVRSITLSKLKLIQPGHVLWDIGSGSGSVGIEASFLIPWGTVHTIEKNPERIPDIINNVKNFNCPNVMVTHARFPDDINGLKKPDRIFIGGGGKELPDIINAACEKLLPTGVIVINTVLLQNMEAGLRLLKKKNYNPEMVQIQISRSSTMPFGERLEALNPVWILSGTKPKE